MRKFSIYLAVLFGLMPLLVYAHGDNYLEFNPDKSSSLKDADVATPSQVFFAQNDFLGGFDFWLANPGSAGTATFSLLNQQGIVLSARTVTVPNIAITSSGTRFHVDLNSQLPVLADEKYSIRITSSMPELRLYYSGIQLVSHNAPFISPYITGVGMLGSEEQHFSFKYALYELNESSAPIISNVGWAVTSGTQMKVTFNGNEAIDYRVEYGPAGQGYAQSTNFIGDYEFCMEGISSCDITISVSPSTNYEYRLTVKDAWGNQSQVTGTFTSGQGQTPAPTPTPQDGAPVISNLRVAEVTHNSVAVAWTTNEVANGDLIIKFAGFITVAAKADPTFELEHYIEIDPILSAGTAYTAQITSRDLDNNAVTASLSFTTTSQPTPTPTPTPTQTPLPPTGSPTPTESPAATPTSTATPTPQPTGVTTDNGTIQWSPPASSEPIDGYRIDIFDESGKLVETIFAPSGSHSIAMPELAEGEYNIIVYANNEGIFQKVAPPKKFATEPPLLQRLLGLWPFLLAAFALIGVFVWLRLRKKAPPPPRITTKVLPS